MLPTSFKVEEIVAQREIILPVIIVESFVSTFSVVEPLLARVFWKRRETRHYVSLLVTVLTLPKTDEIGYSMATEKERIPTKLNLVWNYFLVCVLPSCYSSQAFAIKGMCHLLKVRQLVVMLSIPRRVGCN